MSKPTATFQQELDDAVRRRTAAYEPDHGRCQQLSKRLSRAAFDYLSLSGNLPGGPNGRRWLDVRFGKRLLLARLRGIAKTADQISDLVSQPSRSNRDVGSLAGHRIRLIGYLTNAERLMGPWIRSTQGSVADLVADFQDTGGAPDVISSLAPRSTDKVELHEVVRFLLLSSDPHGVTQAAMWMRQAAEQAAERIERVGAIITHPGHSGDRALEGWLDDMLTIWQQNLGRVVATSVGSPGATSKGKAGGPLIEFLTNFGSLVQINLNPDAWRSHVRTALSIRESKNT